MNSFIRKPTLSIWCRFRQLAPDKLKYVDFRDFATYKFKHRIRKRREFGSLFLATGSLIGPLLAHAAINIANLRFIRDTDVDAPAPRRLGGLLGR